MGTLNRKMLFSHLGEVYFRISITALVVAIVSLLAGIMAVFITLILFLFILLIVIGTFGLVFLANPNIFSIANFEKAGEIANFAVSKIAPVSSVVTLAAALLCLAFGLLGEPKKHKGKLIFSGIIIGAAVFLIVMAFSSAGRA